MRRVLSAVFVLVSAVAIAHAQERDSATGLYGRLENGVYVSPTGTFKVESPVLVELGGMIADTPNVVTFQDNFSTLVSIGSFPEDATQRWQLATRGLKDYLVYFFSDFVFPDFLRAFPQTHAEENARFSPGLMGGSLTTFVLLPGGSMFADKIPSFLTPRTPLVAKRGNMIFVKNGCTFVISIELAERITERTEYHKTSAEEDAILRDRLAAMAAKIRFIKPPPEP